MSGNIEFLKSELAALQKARWGGTRSVTYQGNGVSRTVEFRSDAELARAIADLENRIYGGKPRNVTIVGIRRFSPHD